MAQKSELYPQIFNL
jgi:hypothetical protein